jgi:hypothetical protein
MQLVAMQQNTIAVLQAQGVGTPLEMGPAAADSQFSPQG